MKPRFTDAIRLLCGAQNGLARAESLMPIGDPRVDPLEEAVAQIERVKTSLQEEDEMRAKSMEQVYLLQT